MSHKVGRRQAHLRRQRRTPTRRAKTSLGPFDDELCKRLRGCQYCEIRLCARVRRSRRGVSMKRWVRTVVVCVAGSVLAASACSIPQIIREEESARQHSKQDAAAPDGGNDDMHIKVPDGGNTPG